MGSAVTETDWAKLHRELAAVYAANGQPEKAVRHRALAEQHEKYRHFRNEPT